MKNLYLALCSLLILHYTAQALSFTSDTIFLQATTQAECEAQDGSWIEWYTETYCTKAPEPIFSDVPTTHPHAEAIDYIQTQGIVNGYADGTFKPDDTINRVELLKILIKTEYPGNAECRKAYNYNDVDWTAWYGTYLQVASCLNLVEGYADGSFKPDSAVLVPEAAKIISGGFRFDISSSSNPAWYAPFMHNLENRQAIPFTIESINAALTRGQMAEIIYRLKTETTNKHSVPLTVLEGWSTTTKNAIAEELEAETGTDVDAELDALFEDLFEEDDLNLDSLIDF